ncbi:Flp pilus assembly protein TadD, contains TPR repeats [Modicisalibacter muralis]|uniref:Flp pilus assembly protein TadD, contains TPR repeats n=1 Tax=Modicisalibacter muralis TaxID=119000 RepID=A0A1G9NIU3_9GAMM|nr:tetratricopeptide repeat protein [Halomonas muralis]SDL86311.1 Flp pilus assembly protein TadD, contains TPR repeats [Halomonas muralis]
MLRYRLLRNGIRLVFLVSCLTLTACATTAQQDEQSHLLALADDVARHGDHATAASMYERALEMSSDTPEIHVRLGDALLAAGDLEGAAQAYRDALALDITHPKALLGLGSTQLRLGNVERAVRNLQKAAPELDTVPAWSRLGVAQALLGHGQAAQRAFTHAVSLAPKNSLDERTNLALAQSLAGDDAEAVSQMRQVSASPLAEDRHFRNLLLVLVLAGQTQQATTVDIPDMPQARRQSLIEQAQRIRDVADPAQRARMMGLNLAP